MKAIGQSKYGGPEVLEFVEVPQPALRPGDLLVKVHSFGVNPTDTYGRRGGQAGEPIPNAPQIVGWDGAGVVVEAGPQASLFKAGEEVFFAGDASRQGCYAELVAIDERIVAHKPRTLGFPESAALPLTSLTAWEALFENLLIPTGPSGEACSLLIVGGAGGVGSIATQIAKRVAGLYVVSTASRPETREHCLEMGADAVIDHLQDMALQLQALGLEGVDYVLNTARPTDFPALAKCVKPVGRICTITSGKDILKTVDPTDLFARRITIGFELMFTRPRLNVEPEKQGQILKRIAELVDRKVLTSTLTETLDWRDIQEAHRMIENHRTIGKIVLNVTD
jgi:zinc-binding alcohol dehydrogenase family protein